MSRAERPRYGIIPQLVRRRRGGLSLAQAAAESGLPASTLRRIETGFVRVELRTLLMLARWLPMSLEELVRLFEKVREGMAMPIDPAEVDFYAVRTPPPTHRNGQEAH